MYGLILILIVVLVIAIVGIVFLNAVMGKVFDISLFPKLPALELPSSKAYEEWAETTVDQLAQGLEDAQARRLKERAEYAEEIERLRQEKIDLRVHYAEKARISPGIIPELPYEELKKEMEETKRYPIIWGAV